MPNFSSTLKLACLPIPSSISINAITTTNEQALKEWQQKAPSYLGHSAWPLANQVEPPLQS
jgi:hypothetical protein